jgi:hypothetical protein
VQEPWKDAQHLVQVAQPSASAVDVALLAHFVVACVQE